METGTVSVADFDFTLHWEIPDILSTVEKSSSAYPILSPRFLIRGCILFLKMYPHSGNKFLRLYLNLESTTVEKNVDLTFYLKKTDGTAYNECMQSNQCFKFPNSVWIQDHFVTLRELQDKDSDLVCAGMLTVMCRVKEIASETATKIPMSWTLSGLDTLSSDFGDFFTNKEACDVCLRVQNKEFQVHRAILMARSSVFAAMFKNNTFGKESGIVTIPDCDPDSFEDFLKYLYTGMMEEISWEEARHLYVTADKYDMKELRAFCVTSMTRTLAVENVCDVVTLADLYEEAELLASCQTFFKHNFKEIIPSAGWSSLIRADCELANKMLQSMDPTVAIPETEM